MNWDISEFSVILLWSISPTFYLGQRGEPVLFLRHPFCMLVSPQNFTKSLFKGGVSASLGGQGPLQDRGAVWASRVISSSPSFVNIAEKKVHECFARRSP